MLSVFTTEAWADDSLKEFLQQSREELNDFRDKALSDREAFRDSALNQLARWIAQPWEPRPMEPPVPVPHDEPPVPPVIIPKDEPAPTPEEEPVRDNPVVAPKPTPSPPPPRPILPPAPLPPEPDFFTFTCYGTSYRVDASEKLRLSIPRSMSGRPAEATRYALSSLDGEAFNRLVTSLSEQASSHNLSDWAYLKLTEHFCKSFIPTDENARHIMQGLLLVSAGYDVRFGGSTADGRVYTLVGCRELLPGKPYYIIDGNRYYPFENTPQGGIDIAPKAFSSNRLITAQPSGKEKFDYRAGKPHHAAVCTHIPHCWENKCAAPTFDISLTGNLNRMDFLTDCPIYLDPQNDYSKWNTYAQTRLSDEYERQLYPPLRQIIGRMDKLQAVNILMKFVEAFDYKLDSEMWGVADRAFFPDETLHYPFRDCEDGAILFTRLVRDLVGLPTALVYYPGHLAAAVAFDFPVTGAYIDHRGRRYTICDPTYYYVDAGVQMPPDVVDASQAVLIPLD